MAKPPANRRLRRFSKPEVRKLKKLLEEGSTNLLNEKFYQEVTDEFNHAAVTKNCIKIEMEQVRRWFSRRKGEYINEADSLPPESMGLIGASGSLSSGSKELTVSPGTKVSNDTSDMPKDIGAKVDEDEIEFEAMSSREGAWYDVVDFLAHRTNSAGHLEVLVRFQDFGAEEDEWIVVIDALRERSIPLESSDCPSVAVGDQVSCFRETKSRAAYYDAHILEIQRKQHDIRGCRCRFLVKFDLNQVEEYVKMKDLCRRPVYKSADGSADNKCEGFGNGIGNSSRGQAQD